jgi:hypothetical protein
LELKGKCLDDGNMWLFEKVGNSHFFIIHRVLKSSDDIRYFGDKDHEQENVRDIELPSSAEGLCRGIACALHRQCTTIDERCRVTRDEDEHLGGIKELRRL